MEMATKATMEVRRQGIVATEVPAIIMDLNMVGLRNLVMLMWSELVDEGEEVYDTTMKGNDGGMDECPFLDGWNWMGWFKLGLIDQWRWWYGIMKYEHNVWVHIV